jgi:hypothetical protein
MAPVLSKQRRNLAMSVKHGLSVMLPLLLIATTMPLAAADKTNDRPLKILSDPATIAQNPLPDFSYAGYGFGLKDLPVDSGTIIDVTKYGAIADDDIDDSAAFLAAIAAANAISGKVTLRVPKGKFIISEILRIERSNFVFEGAGRGKNGTELHFPRPLEMVDKTPEFDELREYLAKGNKRQVEKNTNINALFTAYSWSGGFIRTGPAGSRVAPYLETLDKPLPELAKGLSGKQGQQVVKVAAAAQLKVGQVIQLQWFPVNGEKSAIIKSLYGDTALKIGSHHWTFPKRPLVTQATRVMVISGNDITIGDALLHDISTVQPAVIADWKHLENVGIQGMRLTFPDSPWFGHHQERGYNGIFFTGVFDGWIRDIHIDNADSGILTYDSASATFRDILISGNRKGHYSVHVGNAHNILVSDLTVTNPLIHSLSVNTQSSRAVYQRALVTTEPVLDQHAGANHQNLFDQVTFRISPRRIDGVPTYDLWDGSGAPYWQPGHGRFNTTWNVQVIVEDGALAGETVLLRGLDEGPDARIIGVSGNRPFKVDYRPTPYVEAINSAMTQVPSLYDYQLAKRRR